MSASAVFILDLKGKPLISRNYKGDVAMAEIERFPGLLLQREEEGILAPLLPHGHVHFLWIKHNNLYRTLTGPRDPPRPRCRCPATPTRRASRPAPARPATSRRGTSSSGPSNPSRVGRSTCCGHTWGCPAWRRRRMRGGRPSQCASRSRTSPCPASRCAT
uniref:Uncharacterized protein n=1 Tax=Pavo cristatus TaxID=9049 RepID=A0A8C9LBH0_PAVCR